MQADAVLALVGGGFIRKPHWYGKVGEGGGDWIVLGLSDF